MRRVEFGARLPQLLIDFGCVDLRQQVALFDLRAYVEIPAFQVPTGACIDRRIYERLSASGQDHFLSRCAVLRMSNVYGQDRRLLSRVLQFGGSLHTRPDAAVDLGS